MKKRDELKQALAVDNIRIPNKITDDNDNIVDNVPNVKQQLDTDDSNNNVNDLIASEKLPSDMKINHLLKYLSGTEQREKYPRITGWIPMEMKRGLLRLQFKLQDLALRQGNTQAQAQINMSTVLKVMIAESMTRIENLIDRELENIDKKRSA